MRHSAKPRAIGKSHDAIVNALRTMEEGQTLVVQSGRPVALMRTHPQAPLVIMANCNSSDAGRARRCSMIWRNAASFVGAVSPPGAGSTSARRGSFKDLRDFRADRGATGTAEPGRAFRAHGGGSVAWAGRSRSPLGWPAPRPWSWRWMRADREAAAGRVSRVRGSIARRCAGACRALAGRKDSSFGGAVRQCCRGFSRTRRAGHHADVVTDQTSAHDLVYGYVPIGFPAGMSRAEKAAAADRLTADGLTSIAAHVTAMLEFKARGAVVFDNGNLIRSQAKRAGVTRAFDIPVFTEAFLRPLFCRGIGPFRWIALSGDEGDIRRIDAHLLSAYSHNRIVSNWIQLASQWVPFEGLPARIAWLGHGERTKLALEVNAMVSRGEIKGPIAFTRDHLDAASMAHPTS